MYLSILNTFFSFAILDRSFTQEVFLEAHFFALRYQPPAYRGFFVCADPHRFPVLAADGLVSRIDECTSLRPDHGAHHDLQRLRRSLS